MCVKLYLVTINFLLPLCEKYGHKTIIKKFVDNINENSNHQKLKQIIDNMNDKLKMDILNGIFYYDICEPSWFFSPQYNIFSYYTCNITEPAEIISKCGIRLDCIHPYYDYYMSIYNKYNRIPKFIIKNDTIFKFLKTLFLILKDKQLNNQIKYIIKNKIIPLFVL